jgi:hypothetical protein
VIQAFQREECFIAPIIRTVIYPVKDLAQTKALYGKLAGVEPYMDAPYYVGFRVGRISAWTRTATARV